MKKIFLLIIASGLALAPVVHAESAEAKNKKKAQHAAKAEQKAAAKESRAAVKASRVSQARVAVPARRSVDVSRGDQARRGSITGRLHGKVRAEDRSVRVERDRRMERR